MGEQAAYPQEYMENGFDNIEDDEMNGHNPEENGEEDDGVDDINEDEDISQEEIDMLNNRMDELNGMLDTMEQKNDDIYSELLKLLKIMQTNREMKEQLQGSNNKEVN